MVSPQAKREVVTYLTSQKSLKVDRALKLVGLRTSTYYYKKIIHREDELLKQQLIDLSRERTRWGFPRILNLARRRGIKDNHKRIYRIYCKANLQLQKRIKKKKQIHLRLVLNPVTKPNQRWSMDFVSDQVTSGRKFRCFNVVDDYTHECVMIKVDSSLKSEKLVSAFKAIALTRNLPEEIVCDNGPEFISQNLDIWAYQNNVKIKFIQPGKPTQNAFVESFNGKFRDECLNQHWFLNLEEARKIIEEWRKDYNENRPHRSLKMKTPNEFARNYINNIN